MSTENIRNFCIIAHVDHGKSTLADRFLELTGTVEKRKMREQYLDMMDLERERGITIKMQPVRMKYKDYTLNLIDTPGHVDFSYEVSRALAAVEGAILLVDATKGIEAQTLAHAKIAIEQGLTIIPAVNKIDLAQARITETERGIEDLLLSFDYAAEKIFRISGKTGEGVSELLNAVIEKIPCPELPIITNYSPRSREGGAGQLSITPLRALIFDSIFDSYKGVVAYVRIKEGRVSKNDTIFFIAGGIESEMKELGYFSPEFTAASSLEEGEIGYIATGMKEAEKVKIGDTITIAASGEQRAVSRLPGYKEPQPLVFASVFPTEGDEFDSLKDAISELKLNDASLYFEPDYSEVLGRGMKCGFLGMLHMEITLERLRREFHIETVVTSPSVVYEVKMKNGEEMRVYTPSKFPDVSKIEKIFEPYAILEILTPSSYLSPVMSILKDLRGEYRETENLGQEHLRVRYLVPLAEIITDFHDTLKSVSSGFASLSYEFAGTREADVVKMDILLAGEKIETLARIVPRDSAYEAGKRIVGKLKEIMPPEQFAVAIQAAVGGKIIARETKSAMRKDVTGYLYGGDYTRKRKLLEKQKKGKKRLGEHAHVRLDNETLMKLFKSS
ncbi:MAG: elongation factor 4 [Candidatus Spechtbacteria bacterium]|nr:elongation factor 4 [Candidatus Spechtbacteria bacterium]